MLFKPCTAFIAPKSCLPSAHGMTNSWQSFDTLLSAYFLHAVPIFSGTGHNIARQSLCRIRPVSLLGSNQTYCCQAQQNYTNPGALGSCLTRCGAQAQWQHLQQSSSRHSSHSCRDPQDLMVQTACKSALDKIARPIADPTRLPGGIASSCLGRLSFLCSP